MAGLTSILLISILGAVSALPVEDPVLIKWTNQERYQYLEDSDGKLHLIDRWMKVSDFKNAARYNPDTQNVYHLFTRNNQQRSQPFRLNDNNALRNSNFNRNRRTIFIIHGWTGSATASVNTVLVPAFLRAEDLNVIVVDWSIGASVAAGNNGPINAVSSGQSVARVMNWIMAQRNVNIISFHLVGFSLGAHQAGVAGRNVRGNVPYITALDPGANMGNSGHIFSRNAGTYTEAIHTNAEIMGHGHPLAHVDFYPNGGDFHPGCGLANFLCNHNRSFYFFAETLTTSTGFTGRRCATYAAARLGNCAASGGTLRMGGLRPKTGSSGLFHLLTNASPPFNRG